MDPPYKVVNNADSFYVTSFWNLKLTHDNAMTSRRPPHYWSFVGVSTKRQ